MKIKILGCYGGQFQGFGLTSFLVNDSILIDAGSPTEALTLEEQHKIRHVFVSHTHLDHIKGIAFLADNRSLKKLDGDKDSRTLKVHSIQENIDILEKHFLNDLIWPDFTKIPSADAGILELEAIEKEVPVDVGGLRVTPIPVNHPVPCTGFLLEEGDKQFIYSADTGHTDRLWEVANAQPNLKGIIVDCSFPNAHERVAEVSGHLTPNGLAKELEKCNKVGEVPLYLYHMKAETLSTLISEVEGLDIPHLRMLSQVDELVF